MSRKSSHGLYPEPVFKTRDGKGHARESDKVGWMKSGRKMEPAVLEQGVWVNFVLASRFDGLRQAV